MAIVSGFSIPLERLNWLGLGVELPQDELRFIVFLICRFDVEVCGFDEVLFGPSTQSITFSQIVLGNSEPLC